MFKQKALPCYVLKSLHNWLIRFHLIQFRKQSLHTYLLHGCLDVEHVWMASTQVQPSLMKTKKTSGLPLTQDQPAAGNRVRQPSIAKPLIDSASIFCAPVCQVLGSRERAQTQKAGTFWELILQWDDRQVNCADYKVQPQDTGDIFGAMRLPAGAPNLVSTTSWISQHLPSKCMPLQEETILNVTVVPFHS